MYILNADCINIAEMAKKERTKYSTYNSGNQPSDTDSTLPNFILHLSKNLNDT